MNVHRDFFALYMVAAAAFVLVLVVHLPPLLSVSHAVFAGDRLPKHALVASVAPVGHHSASVQSSHILVKPAN
jgi:hypothetical protein